MSLIDLYLEEVGRHLPEKVRADLQQEIRSVIEDTLEDQSGKQGRSPDEGMIVEVLKKLGPPEKVAASYLPPRYLIGPNLYPHFITTLQIVLPIVVILTALSMAVTLGFAEQSPEGVVKTILNVVGGVLNAMLYSTGIVVVIFAILQYTAPQLGTRQPVKDWDPRQMKPGPDPERIKYADLILEAVFSLVAIVLFNFYPQVVAIYNQVNGQWTSVTFLTAAFFTYLPFLTVLWALESGFDIALVARGRWEALSRWAAIGLGVFSIALLSWMLSGPAIVALDPDAFRKIGWTVLNPQLLIRASQGLALGVRIAMGITIVVNLVKIGQHLYRLLLREHLQLAGFTK